MDAVSLISGLTKFIREVAKPSQERHTKAKYGIVAGIRRFMAEKICGFDIQFESSDL